MPIRTGDSGLEANLLNESIKQYKEPDIPGRKQMIAAFIFNNADEN